MSFFSRNWGWVLATLIVAALVHVGSVMALPHAIMMRAMAGISRGVGYNHMAHGKRATDKARAVVRPSPDLLYSTCAYDLEKAGGALHVHAKDMPATYWSVSLFDADTNNFYVVNDRHAKNGAVDFLIVDAKWEKPMPMTLVRSPTNRGIVLFRTLIDNEKNFAAIDAARKHAACEAMK